MGGRRGGEACQQHCHEVAGGVAEEGLLQAGGLEAGVGQNPQVSLPPPACLSSRHLGSTNITPEEDLGQSHLKGGEKGGDGSAPHQRRGAVQMTIVTPNLTPVMSKIFKCQFLYKNDIIILVQLFVALLFHWNLTP